MYSQGFPISLGGFSTTIHMEFLGYLVYEDLKIQTSAYISLLSKWRSKYVEVSFQRGQL